MSDLELVKRTVVAQIADKDQEVLLLERLKGKDPQALSEIYEIHSPSIYGSLLQILDQATAGEVLIDVFVKLWQQPESFDPQRANLRVFLLVIARARALERQRERKDLNLMNPDPEPEISLLDVRPTLEGDSYRDAAWERREELRLQLQELSVTHREVILRTFVHGESQEALARELEVPVSTVKSRLNYALANLRKAYDRKRQQEQAGLSSQLGNPASQQKTPHAEWQSYNPSTSDSSGEEAWHSKSQTTSHSETAQANSDMAKEWRSLEWEKQVWDRVSEVIATAKDKPNQPDSTKKEDA